MVLQYMHFLLNVKFLAHLTFLAKKENHLIFYSLMAVASLPNKSIDDVINKIEIVNDILRKTSKYRCRSLASVFNAKYQTLT
jgi:hypothetical protein